VLLEGLRPLEHRVQDEAYAVIRGMRFALFAPAAGFKAAAFGQVTRDVLI
jgi:hypothetical protein